MWLYKDRFISCIFFLAVFLLAKGMYASQKKDDILFIRNIDFNDGWKFKRCELVENSVEAFKDINFNDEVWETVMLPHTARIEPLVVNDQWQGICWYRKKFLVNNNYQKKKIYIEFEAAMQIASVWLNGKYITTHYGGYLPFTIDITDQVMFEKYNIIVVKLDNQDNPDVPPGKPLRELDFCMYGGLYRNVKMHITDRLHFTDAVYANQVAGGGIFVQYPVVSKEHAQICVQTHIINERDEQQICTVVTQLFDHKDRLIVEKASRNVSLNASENKNILQTIDIQQPSLWHPHLPYLYKLHSKIFQGDEIIDYMVTRIGIRNISLDAADGFSINGEKFYLRGSNRHQEYPYIGYAISDNANYRDAIKIKQAGFDFVRLSHYPHATAFLDACDELGILVMDAIPGWQYFGNELFQQKSLQDCRDMIRRDRNHPSVVLWEVSLNESGMTNEFMQQAHQIAHEEYPGDQCYTCGWQNSIYDVFIPARQHGQAPAYWREFNGKPLFITEYGDWEYYAQNAGFNQIDYNNLSPEERNSRQLRGFGEKRLLQQALNFQEALNDNLACPAFGCANWLMFDYNRGYADDIEASGIMDIFRIPKLSHYFYQSQRTADSELFQAIESGPMIFIAHYWSEDSDSRVKVFSNCDQVKLVINGKEVATQNPDNDLYSCNLTHPPFTFQAGNFHSGVLEAIGFINGKSVAYHKVLSPLKPHAIHLTADLGGKKPTIGKKDVFFLYASILDQNGTLIPTASEHVLFELKGPGRLIGQNPMKAEAGIATILVETIGAKGTCKIKSRTETLNTASIKIKIH